MKILFISISSIPDVNLRSISLELLREFQRQGHEICILCAQENSGTGPTYLSEEEGFKIVRVRIGANKKANLLQKGITTVIEPYQYIRAIQRFYGEVKFDLVLFPTPPITQVKAVEFVKKRDQAQSYLLLKDIFPQNAVDLGMMKTAGVKGLVYRHFRRVEKSLYRAADHIGCMSQANVEYLLRHNPEIDSKKVEVCPNSIRVRDMSIDPETRRQIRDKYGIPQDKKVFVYGGNLGRPQGIPFILECMKAAQDLDTFFFLLIGDGTEYGKIEEYVRTSAQANLKLLKKLPREEYDSMVGACDVGLIFLDHRFSIPNFPSRLLAYMQAKIPVLACTDKSTDIGKAIMEGGFGWWCESNDSFGFKEMVGRIASADLSEMGQKAFEYAKDQYDVEKSCRTILKWFE